MQSVFRLRDYHPLWSAFPYRSARRLHRYVGPQPRRINPSVWPLPRSLATTSGISVDFSSSPYLDVSVQAVPYLRLFCSTQVDRVLLCRVSPFGNLRINAYVQLPEAYRSLSRPSSAPDAKAFPLRSYQLDLVGTLFSVPPGSHKNYAGVTEDLYAKLYLPLRTLSCALDSTISVSSVACSQF